MERQTGGSTWGRGVAVTARGLPQPPRPGWRSAAECASYVLLAVCATWPLALSLRSCIPQGQEDCATVPLLNLWTLGWNVDRAGHGFKGYWDAPIFYPTTRTFAFSEPQPLLVLTGPLAWLTSSWAAAYNLFLLGSLALNGWSAARLLRTVGLSAGAAWVGGCFVELLPFVHWQLGVLQLIPLWGIAWTLQALWTFSREPTWPKGAALGLAVAVSYLLCANYAVFLCVALVGPALVLANSRWRRREFFLGLLAAVTICGLILSPVIVVQREVARVHHFEAQRTRELLLQLSARPADYTAQTWPAPIRCPYWGTPERLRYWRLGAGLSTYILACAGFVTGAIRPDRRRWTLFLGAFGLAAFGLSLGPSWELPAGLGAALPVGIRIPYEGLRSVVPGLKYLRNVFRFAVFMQLACSLLAAGGAEALWLGARQVQVWARRRARRDRQNASVRASRSLSENHACSGWPGLERFAKPRKMGFDKEKSLIEHALRTDSQTVGAKSALATQSETGARTAAAPRWLSFLPGAGLALRAACVLLVAGVIIESWPRGQGLSVVPEVASNLGWTDWLRTNTEPESVIACWPFPPGTRAIDYAPTTVWMYWGLFHERRMVNGYSGFFPMSFLNLKRELGTVFPTRRGLDLLRAAGVTHVVVRQGSLQPTPEEGDALEWTRVFSDDRAGIDILRMSRQSAVGSGQ